MQLKPQDLLVALRLAVGRRQEKWTYPLLGKEVGLSASEAFQAIRRAMVARLVVRLPEGDLVASRANLLEFLIHGLKYAFPPERGQAQRGIPTAHGAPVLREHFSESKDPVPVWPHPEGKVRGESFKPLYRSVPIAAKDPEMYAALALVDTLRGGSARERQVAERLLQELLNRDDPQPKR
jgi:hypothetical protein